MVSDLPTRANTAPMMGYSWVSATQSPLALAVSLSLSRCLSLPFSPPLERHLAPPPPSTTHHHPQPPTTISLDLPPPSTTHRCPRPPATISLDLLLPSTTHHCFP